jgi:hypothetical protein
MSAFTAEDAVTIKAAESRRENLMKAPQGKSQARAYRRKGMPPGASISL